MIFPPPPPPPLEKLPYGTRLHAGVGQSIVIADLDFETYSQVNLPEQGLAVYATHPSTEVLCAAYDLKDGHGKRLWTPDDPRPDDLFRHLTAGRLLEAWNVGFEYWVWMHVCIRRYGWPHLPIGQLRCAMAKARAHGLPGHLGDAGKVLNIQHKKLEDGKRLIRKFSIPREPSKNDPRTRRHPKDDAVDGKLLYEYCLQDIAAEAEISSLTPDLQADELKFWQVDQAINRRGVQLDLPAIHAAIQVVEGAALKYNAELRVLTGGRVQAITMLNDLKEWLYGWQVNADSLDAEAITSLLAGWLPDEVRRVLEIRQVMGSAAVKKLYAMRDTVAPDGRLYNLFQYHASRTGRAAGRGVQPQNLPNSGMAVDECSKCKRHFKDVKGCPWCGQIQYHRPLVEWNPQAVEEAISVIRSGSVECVELFYGDALEAISGTLRGMFIPAPGCDFICSDYSAIEAVVLAALAGEEWRLEVFRTHGAIYETSASKITSVPFEDYIKYKKETGKHHADRKIGKVAELASGYQGWINAWKAFKADEFLTEEQIKQAILAWRKASPAIVALWGGQQKHWRPDFHGLEGAAVAAILKPGSRHRYRDIIYYVEGDILYCELPSGRNLTYHKPRLRPNDKRPGTQAISFESWNTNPKYGYSGWVRMDTYGGKLTENVCQAVARDILAHAIVNLEDAGYPVVLHVHDEIVCEVPEGFGSVEELESIMSALPAWAAGWPVKASGGWRGKRYAK